jgi:hypothetical protein
MPIRCPIRSSTDAAPRLDALPYPDTPSGHEFAVCVRVVVVVVAVVSVAVVVAVSVVAASVVVVSGGAHSYKRVYQPQLALLVVPGDALKRWQTLLIEYEKKAHIRSAEHSCAHSSTVAMSKCRSILLSVVACRVLTSVL